MRHNRDDLPGFRSLGRILCLPLLALYVVVPLLYGCQKQVGTVFALAIHPKHPDILYLSSDKGLYKTSDAGKSWSRVESGLGTFQILSIAINPLMPSTLYVGTFSDGVYRSADGGRNWMLVNTGMRDYIAVVNAIAIDPQQPAVLYAGTTMGIYKSLDNGGNWERISTGLNSVFVVALAVDPENPDVVYAGTSGGVYKSRDGGARWAISNTGMVEKGPENSMGLGVNAIAFDPRHSGRLFAATAQGLFESRDSAEKWIKREIPDSFVLTVAVQKGPPSLIYAGTNRGLYLSRDDGEHWQKITTQEIRTIVMDPASPGVIYLGTGNGLFRSDDEGKGWRPVEFAR